MADESPRLDLEMLDKLINKLDKVYEKALEVTGQLDKLGKTKIQFGFSKEFRNAAEDLDRLLTVMKGFTRSNFKVTDGMVGFFQDIARISNFKVGRIPARKYNSLAGVIEKLVNLVNTTKVSVSDAKRLTTVMDEFGKIMTTLSSITTGRGIPIRQILVVQSVIKPIINILKDMVALTTSGLTAGKATSLNDVIRSFGDVLYTISTVFTSVKTLPKQSILKSLLFVFTTLRPVLNSLSLMVTAAQDITVTKLTALSDIMENFSKLLREIQKVFVEAGDLKISQLLKLSSFNKAFLPVLDQIARIVTSLAQFDGKGVGNVANVFDGIGAMVRGIAQVITSIKGLGFIGAALQNLIVILPLFGAIQEILRILLRFNPSELNAVGRIFFGLGQSFTAIADILGKIRQLKVGDLVASIGIMIFINRLFKQIRNFIEDTTDFSAAQLNGVGQIFRGIGQIFIGLADSLNALQKNTQDGFIKGILRTLKDYFLLMQFLKPLFRVIKNVLGDVVNIPSTTVQAIGEIFSSLGGISRALAQFSRDAARITTIRELVIIIAAMRGIFGALGGVIKSILNASKKADSVPIGPVKDLLDTILEVVKVFSRLTGDAKGFKKNELKLIEETFKVLPRIFNQFKIKKGTEQSLRSFADLLQIVSSTDTDLSGVAALDKLITVLSGTDAIDVKATGLGELGRELKDFFDSFKGVEANKIEAVSKALSSVKKSSNLVNESTGRLTTTTDKLSDSFEDALRSERIREKVLGSLGTAFQNAGKRALDFLRNVSAPGIIGNSISKMKELGEAVKNIGDELRDVGEEIRDFGTELIDNFGIGTLFSSDAVQGAVDFDRIGTQLKVFGNLNDEARAQAEEFAFELGRQYPISANEALDATLDLLKAGQSLDDIRFALPSIADLTALSDEGNLEDISSAVIAVVSQFDEFGPGVAGTFENTSVAADLLSAAADGSVSSVESLAEGLTKVGPIANSFGFGLDETVSALALFSNAGLDGAQAGTQLKSLLNNLQTTTAQKAMASLGIKVADASGNFLSLNDIVGNINTALNETSTITFVPQSPLGDDAQARYDAATGAAARASRQLALYRDGLTGGALDQEKANKKIAEYEQILSNANSVIAEVTGSQEEADAVTREITRTQEENAKTIKDLAGSYGSVGLNILLASGDDGIQAFVDGMNDVLPASERAQLLLDNLAGDVTQLTGSFQTAMTIAFLPALNEFFRPIVRILRFVVDGFINMDRKVLEFIGTAITLTSVGLTLVGVFAVIFGSLLQVGGTILVVVGSLLNFTTVIGLVVGGVTALATGLIAIVAVLGIFVPLIIGVTAVFKALFEIFSRDIGGAGTAAINFFRTLGNAIQGILAPFGAFVRFVTALISGPGGGELGVLETVGSLVANVFDDLSDTINTGFIGRLSSMGLVFSSILDSFNNPATLDIFRRELAGLFNVFSNFGAIVEAIGFDQAISVLLQSADDSLGNFAAKFIEVFSNVLGGSFVTEAIADIFRQDGFGAGFRAGFNVLIDNLRRSALNNRDQLKEIFVSVMKFLFSPIKAVGFFADLFGIKPLQDFVTEFNNLFEGIVGGAFDFIFNLLEGQSFNDAFINAFGDGAQPLLDLITELGTAAENIFNIVSKIFEDFFGRFVDEGEDVGIVNVLFGIVEKLTQGLALLNDLILSPLAEGDVAGAFANIGTLLAEGFLGIVGTFTSLLDGVDLIGIFTGIANSVVNLLGTALSSAISTVGDILGIDVSSIIGSIEDTLEANVLALEEGGAAGFFVTAANSIVGLFVAAVQTAFAAIGEITGIDTTAIQEALGGKLGDVLETLRSIFFGGEGETSIFDDIATIANNVAIAIQAILDAFSGGEGGDPSATTSALDSIVNFFGDLAVLTLDAIEAPLIIIKDFTSFLADQNPAQLIQLGVGVGAIGAGFLVWTGLTSIGGIAALLPFLSGAIISLGTAPLATISAGISSLGAAFSTFAGSLIGKLAGLISIALIVKNVANNIEGLTDTLQLFADGNYGEGIQTFFDTLGDIFVGIGLDAYELLGLDQLLGRSREEIVATISQVESLFSTFGVLFSLFIETQLIAPLRNFIDVDVADVINEVRKLTELAQIALSGGDTGKLLGDESFIQTLFSQDDLNINALAGFINNDQTSEFLKEEIRILGRKNAPALAEQLATTLNGASTEDLIKWGEIIDATGIFPEVAAAILNEGGDIGPIVDAILASGGEIDPESTQRLSAIIQKHILDNLTFDTFETDLGILEGIRDSIVASGGDSTAIDEAIAYIKGQFESLAGQEGEGDGIQIEQDIEIVPGDVTVVDEDGVITELPDSIIPPVTGEDGGVQVEVPTTYLPKPIKYEVPEDQEITPTEEQGDVVIEGGSATIVPSEITIDTSDAEVPEDTAFEEFGAETLANPEEVAALNEALAETNTELTNIELAFGLLQSSAPIAVESLSLIKESFNLAQMEASAFYNTIVLQSIAAGLANLTAFAIINGNLNAFDAIVLKANLDYRSFTTKASQNTIALSLVVQTETRRMISVIDQLSRSVKVLTANLRDAIDLAQKAAAGVAGINGVEPATPSGGRAIGGVTLRGGAYSIGERGTEVYEENGEQYLIAGSAGRVLTMAQAFPELASSRSSSLPGQSAMQSSSGLTNINSTTTISEGDIIINITEPGASATDIANEVRTVLDSREGRGGADDVSVREKLRTNHR